MAYVPNPADPTQPTEDKFASTAAAEFRALKTAVSNLGVGAARRQLRRQTILSGPWSALISSAPEIFIAGTYATGTVAFNTTALSYPTFANGWSSNGQVDLIAEVDNNSFGSTAALAPFRPAPNQTIISAGRSFIFWEWLTNFSVAQSTMRTPHQASFTYTRSNNALLRFDGADASTAILDDYGNTWTQTGGGGSIVSTNPPLAGVKSWNVGGNNNYFQTSDITTFGGLDWSINFKLRFTALPTDGNTMSIVTAVTSADAGVLKLELLNTTGTLRMLLSLSSTTAVSSDIANGTGAGAGAITSWAINQWYEFAISFDHIKSRYIVQVAKEDGTSTVDIIVNNALSVVSFLNLRFGNDVNSLIGSRGLNGQFAQIRICRGAILNSNANITAVSAAFAATGCTWRTTAWEIEGLFYNRQQDKMYQITGPSMAATVTPPMTPVLKLPVGEIVYYQDGTAEYITYAYGARSVVGENTDLLTLSTTRPLTHNLGYTPEEFEVCIVNLSTDAGYAPGDVYVYPASYSDAGLNRFWGLAPTPYRVNAKMDSSALAILPKVGTATAPMNPNSWFWRVICDRNW